MPRSLCRLSIAVLAALGCSDDTPPTLVGQRPLPDASNVWVFAPITLTFSEPLAPESVVPAAFQLRVEGAGAPLPLRVRLAEDRRTVRLTLERPPAGPARVELTVGGGLGDPAGNTFAGARWSWSLPLWQEVQPPGEAAGAARALHPWSDPDRAGDLLLVWEARGQLRAARLGEAGWTPMGEAVPAGEAWVGPVASADGPVLGWLERGDLQLRRWDGTSWAALPEGMPDGAAAATRPSLASDEAGKLHAAWAVGERELQVASLRSGGWQVRRYQAAGAVVGHDLAVHSGRPLLAIAEKGAGSSDLKVVAWDEAAGDWRPLGAALDRLPADEVTAPALAVGPSGTPVVAWQESDGQSDHLYVARFENGGWSLLGRALDLDVDARATAPRLRIAGNGDPVVAWREQGAGEAAWSHVARWRGDDWTVLGAFPSSAAPDLTLDAAGEPTLVGAGAAVRRFNATPEMPPGLKARSGPSPCRLPEENDPAFPRTLAGTGCFTDPAARTPAAGVVPYDVISELWSDGAAKRRFLVLPDGQAFGYKEHDSWETPPGTIFIKEFLVEVGTALAPVETRFLVKRCEEGDCENPWQGYSYQWNDARTEATLLTNSREVVYKDWPAAAGTHRHTYPSQTQCGQCHLLASGGTLGIQTSQLNRPFNYGGLVDNQLRALEKAGALRRPEASTGPTPRVPAPLDVSYPLEARVRGYFQGNCANCHRPGGSWPLMDFRYHVPLGASRLCQLIKPGDARGSRLYHKSQTRDTEQLPDGTTGRPMPPIGSLLLDQRQLVVLQTWIDGMASCP